MGHSAVCYIAIFLILQGTSTERDNSPLFCVDSTDKKRVSFVLVQLAVRINKSDRAGW